MAIIKEEQNIEQIDNEYLDEEGTQELINQLKAYADAELASSPSP